MSAVEALPGAGLPVVLQCRSRSHKIAKLCGVLLCRLGYTPYLIQILTRYFSD